MTEIAWKTTTTLNVSNQFNYECLYELESMYNLQRRVQIEINKSANALQKRELEDLMHILEFLEQLGSQLQNDYESIKKDQFTNWYKKKLENKEEEWINIDVLVSKGGKWYCAENTFKPKPKDNAQVEGDDVNITF